MKTYVARSPTNYGETITIVNADSEEDARAIFDADDFVWDGYELEVLDTATKGPVFLGGGSG